MGRCLKNMSSDDHSSGIISMGFNADATYLATGDEEKTLKLWDVSTWTCVASRHLPKKSTAIRFAHLPGTNTQTLLVSEKAGDVYAYPVPDVSRGKRLLLGHTASIITEMLLTPDQRFIITADRDEKLRVTNFPRTHNIESFCLGHTDFVSAAALVSSDLMVSGGGDGTLRLWKFLQGTEVHRVDNVGGLLEGKCKAVRCVAAHPASGVIAASADGSNDVHLYKLNAAPTPSLLPLSTLPLPSPASHLFFTSTGDLVAECEGASGGASVLSAFLSGAGGTFTPAPADSMLGRVAVAVTGVVAAAAVAAAAAEASKASAASAAAAAGGAAEAGGRPNDEMRKRHVEKLFENTGGLVTKKRKVKAAAGSSDDTTKA